MDAPIFVENPAAVRESMDAMPAAAQARGEKYFAEGRVHQLRYREDTGEFLARVEGTQPYEVTLRCDHRGLVEDRCSCPLGGDCKHVYATLKALLIEHTQGSVRRLSEAARTKEDTVPAARTRGREGRPFAEEVAAALGRKLVPAEKNFLQQLARLHVQCQQGKAISQWDFQELGLPLGTYGNEPMKIWPSVPKTPRQFWLFLAHELTRRRRPIPEFLLPVTDFADIAAELKLWQRQQEIQRWRSALGQATNYLPAPAETPLVHTDLRVSLGERGAELQWLRPGQAGFAPMKQTQMRELQRQMREGETQLPPEAEWLWPPFEQKLNSYGRTLLEYYERDTQRALTRWLRLPALHSRLVNARGETLRFSEESLHWQLIEPAEASGDYILRLARADGSRPPPLVCVIGGRNSLYVTEGEVFTGPFHEGGILDPSEENRIPAQALEEAAGVALLHSLGVALPERLRDRVKVQPLRLRLVCELAPLNPGSDTEACLIRAEAMDEDGRVREAWGGQAWVPEMGKSSKLPKTTEAILVTDRSRLANPVQLLANLTAKWEPYRERFVLRVTKKFPDLFAEWIKTLSPQIDLVLKGDLQTLAAGAVAGRVKLEVTEGEIDWFDLRVVLDVEDTTLSQEELRLLLNARGGFVRLEGKGWRRLKFDLSTDEDEQLARLGLNPRELTAEPQRLHALQLSDKAARKFLPEEHCDRIERRVEEIKARVTPGLPATIRAELRPYQLEGFHFLAYLAANRFGGVLADDMGLGKTLQTLAWLEHLRREGPGRSALPSLVVCPKSVTDNWRAEAERFVEGLRVKVWGADDLKHLPRQLAGADLHVLNYNQLRTLGESLDAVRWLAVILDEGQYIKNPSSITAQIARGLQAAHRLVLSGTPIENRLMDLWSLMAFAMPGALGSRSQFAKMFDLKDDPLARRRLSARVRPFLLRRTKAQVAKDLPDRVEEDLYCEIEGEQKTLYRAELKRAQQMLLRVQTQKQLAEQRFHFLTSLLRLRQICCHPRLVKPDSKAESAKVEALLDQLEPLMEEGHKVLVFSQFVEMLGLLKTELAERGWTQFYLAGETENRGQLVQDFQAADGAAVFLISLKAGGFGLNLTAASYVVLFDPWWNPAVENQAIDRTHRIGQTRNVIAYRLLIKNSIEEKIRALQRQKSTLADDVLGEEKFSQSLSLDDLRYLLADGESA